MIFIADKLIMNSLKFRMKIPGKIFDISDRYKPTYSLIKGAYKSAYTANNDLEDVLKEVSAFSENEGRPPRIMIAKLGQDGHDRGAKVFSQFFLLFLLIFNQFIRNKKCIPKYILNQL